jgi:hypothetical protein
MQLAWCQMWPSVHWQCSPLIFWAAGSPAVTYCAIFGLEKKFNDFVVYRYGIIMRKYWKVQVFFLTFTVSSSPPPLYIYSEAFQLKKNQSSFSKTKRFYHYCVKTSINSKFQTFGGRCAILFAPMVNSKTMVFWKWSCKVINNTKKSSYYH